MVAALLVGCQNIPADEQLLPVNPEEVSLVHNVLLVEFTGYKCSNCPNAAEQAHSLLESFGENLVVVAMHPASNDFTSFSRPELDYTCPEADVYYKALGGTSTTSFPTGSINFAKSFTYYTSWAGEIIREGIQAPSTSIDLSATRTDREAHATIRVASSEKSAIATRVLLWLVENDVLGMQRMPDNSANKEYLHQHMLRAELLSTDGWGEYVSLHGETTINSDFTLPERVVPANCCLVAVLLDDATQEVLNVKQVKL